MLIALFIFHLLLFTWLVTRTPFFRRSGLSPSVLAGTFLFHVAVACLYGYVHTFPADYRHTIDTWRFHYEGLRELNNLKSDPLSFFGELFRDPYHSGFSRLFSTTGSYWNDLKNNVMVKMMTVFDLFSLGNYYTNLIFYNYLVLFGSVALYRVFRDFFPGRTRILFIAIFATPSILFWGSGLHKEGLLFTAIALTLFHGRRVTLSRLRIGPVLATTLSMAMVFILRNNVIFALLPATLAWWWTEKRGGKAWPIFLLVNLSSIIIFFGTPKLIPRIDPPMTMHLRQRSFIALGGRTALPMDELEPNLKGFLNNLPSAANFTFLHPLPGEGGLFYIPFSFEMIACYLLFLISIVYPDRSSRASPLVLFSFNFAILLFLLIGYCVPNVGAIIRYRSLGMPFLFLAATLATDWKRVFTIFQLRTN